MAEFVDVSFSYGEKMVLKDFSFTVNEGESTAILGPSGFGKTTLLNLAAGFIKPQSGKVSFQCSKPSFIFQEDRLLPWQTAIGNLKAVNVDENRAVEYLEKVGLGDALEKYPEELSGGMQRRLAIARCLAFGGDMFFLDEPLRGLDIKTSAEILELIKSDLLGKTALIVTHSPAEAFFLCERIVVAGGEPFRILADRRKSDFADENELSEFLKSVI